jgi:hypothetical protein
MVRVSLAFLADLPAPGLSKDADASKQARSWFDKRTTRTLESRDVDQVAAKTITC